MQSFQPKARNDFAAAFRQYDSRLAFATGIHVLQGEWLSPQEVRQGISDSVEIGKQTGRHILAMTHMMQYTMPKENVEAIFDAVQELQGQLNPAAVQDEMFSR